jgi:hypothetical protein
MGILDWITGKHFDEQPDEDETDSDLSYWAPNTSDANNYEQGQKFARAAIDDRRQNYQRYGYNSFRESVENGGKIWHRIVEQEQAQVNRGQSDRQGQLDYARGARSQYD